MVLLHAHGGNIYSDVQCLEHDVLCPHVDLSMRLTDCWGLSCRYTMKHFYILIIFARWRLGHLADCCRLISISVPRWRFMFWVRFPALAYAIQHLSIYVYIKLNGLDEGHLSVALWRYICKLDWSRNAKEDVHRICILRIFS